MLWNGQHMKKSCSYQKIGQYEVHITSTRIIIEKIQASPIFRDKEREIPEFCHIKSPRIMENHMVVSIEHNRIQKGSTRKGQHATSKGDDVDPENARPQYLYDRLHQEVDEHIHVVHEQWCLSNNKIVEENISAVRDGDLVIIPCESYTRTTERNHSEIVFNSFPITNVALKRIHL